MRPIAEFLLEFASTNWGPLVLIGHAYFEGFILPVAHELFLIPVCLARPNLSFVFALMSTTASTLGIMTGFAIGRWGGHPILKKLFSERLLDKAEDFIHRYDFWAIAIACFTPIPVKVFAILAGAVEIRFKKLVIVAFIFRGARFFLVSSLLFFYGDIAREWILEYLDWFMIGLLIFMVVSFISLRVLAHLGERKGRSPSQTKEGFENP